MMKKMYDGNTWNTVEFQFNKYLKEENGHLIWTGKLWSNGLGRINVTGNSESVRRVYWTWVNGSVPDKVQVLSDCGVKLCVSHLKLGIPGTHCINGHEFTKDNTFIYSSGQRVCKTCKRKGKREKYKKQRDELMRKAYARYGMEYTPE